jgi:outer membrane protein TolC
MLARFSTRLMAALAVVSVGVAMPAWAQEALSLGEAVKRAEADHPAIRSAERAIDAARARETQVVAPPNPNLSLVVDQVPIPDPVGGNYMAGVTQPLLFSGQREAAAELARIERELAELDLVAAKRDLAGRVKEAYLRLLSEEQAVAIARLDAEAAKALLNQTQARYRAGEVARVEVVRAEVDSGRAERERVAAEAQRAQARAKLNVLVGREADAGLALKDMGIWPIAVPAIAVLVERSTASRVELRRSALAIEREAAQRRMAQSAVWTGTEVSVLAGAVGGRPGFTTSLTLPIPLYRQQGEIAEAEANQARAEAEREALRREVTVEVGEAYREVVADAQAVRAYLEVYVPQAERLVANARKRFAAGEGSRVEVTEAARALNETQAEARQAVLEYRLAIVKLEQASGVALWAP